MNAAELPPRPNAADVKDALAWAERKARTRLFSENFEGNLRAEVLHLRARVAELEAERGEPTGTEWGVGDPDDCATDEDVRAVDGPAQFSITDRHFGRALLMRDVWRGPWRAAQ